MINKRLNRDLLRTTVALAIMTTAGAVTTQKAKAAVIQLTVPSQNSTDPQTTNLNNAKSAAKSASSALTSAQAKLTSDTSAAAAASSAVNSQSAVVSNATTAKSNAQSAYDAASSAVSAANQSATSAAVSSAQDKVNSASAQVASDVTALSSAQDAKATADADLSNASAALNSANSAVSAAQSDVNDKSTAAASAAAAVSGSRDTLLSALSSANDALSSARNDYNAAASAAAAASTAVDSAVTALSTASAAKSRADSVASSAAAAQSAAQSSYDALNTDTSEEVSLPHFNLTTAQKAATQAYVQDIKNYFATHTNGWSSSDFSNLPHFQEWENAMTDSSYVESNGNVHSVAYNDWSDTNTTDKSTTVDLNKMTDAQILDLSNFTAAVINQLRKDLGIGNVVAKAVVTTGMVSLAKEVAQEYAARTDTNSGHWIYGLHKAAYDHGLNQTPATDSEKQAEGSNEFGESLGVASSSAYTDNNAKIAEVKDQIVSTIAGMLFDDANEGMGHAMSMIGVYSLQSTNAANNKEYLGTSASAQRINFGGPVYNAHLIHIMQFQQNNLDQAGRRGIYTIDTTHEELAKQNATGMRNVVANPYESTGTTDPKQLAKAQATLDAARSANLIAQADKQAKDQAFTNAQNAYNDARVNYTSAQTTLNSKSSAVDTARSAQTTAQNNLSDYDNAASAATAAQTALSDAQSRLTAAQNEAAAKSSAKSVAQHSAEQANQAVTQASNALSNDRNQLATAQSALDALQRGTGATPAQIQAMHERQSDLTNAINNLTSAQNRLDELNAALTSANSQVAADSAAVSAAQDANTSAQSALSAAQTAYDNDDANTYAADIQFADVTVNVGDVTDVNNLPAPQITNSLIAPQPSAFMILARGTSIPAGTTARWTNPQQVVDDMQVPGNHVEQIDIYFPDDSIAHRTTTIHVNESSQSGSTSRSDNHPASPATPGSGSHPASSVTSSSHPSSSVAPVTSGSSSAASSANSSASSSSLSAASSAGSSASSAASSSTSQAGSAASSANPAASSATSESSAAASHAAGNQPVTSGEALATNSGNAALGAHGAAINDTTAQNGQAVNDTVAMSNHDVTTANTQKSAQKLPQTGNNAGTTLSVLGLLSMAFASLLGFKKRNN